MEDRKLQATARYIVAAASGESAIREALMPNIDETIQAVDAFDREMRISRELRLRHKPTTKKLRKSVRRLSS